MSEPSTPPLAGTPDDTPGHSARGPVAPSQRWIVVADSPFLPADGGGEREHLGFVRAAVAEGLLALLVVPSTGPLDEQAYARELGGAPLLTTRRRTSPLLLAHPRLPYVVASRPAPRGLAARARALAPGATGVVVFSYKSRAVGQALAQGLGLPAVLRQHNREGAYHRSLAAETAGPRGLVLRWEAARIEADERRVGRAGWLAGTADISLADARWRRSTGAHGVVHVPPFASARAAGAPAAAGGREPRAGERVLFVGALDVATNTSALEWLLERVWPQVRRSRPDAVLDVVGRAPGPALRRRLDGLPGVELHADVPDVGPYLARAAVAVNPAVTGSGVNIKVVEYLHAALPTVSTGLATAGLPLRAGVDLEVHDEPDSFAAAVAHLLADPAAAAALGSTGHDSARRILDPRAGLAALACLLDDGADQKIPLTDGDRLVTH